MEHFTSERKLADIIDSNYLLLPVINRFGIRLGFRDKSVKEICDEKGINTDFFLTIINSYHDEAYFPENHFRNFSVIEVLDYLRKTHHYYINHIIPNLDHLLNHLVGNSDDENLALVINFYRKYKNELLDHFMEEENDAFPYAMAVYNNVEKNIDIPQRYSNQCINDYAQEHTNVDEKLFDLKNIIIKYLKPVYKDSDCNDFLFAIFRFDKDLKDHARLEDKILIPMIEKLEQKINSHE